MQARCLNPKNLAYTNYGGRGITICARWLGPQGYVNFLADMGSRPYGKTLDRINPNGNYEPSNSRWATDHVQAINKRPRKTQEPRDEIAAITGIETIV